MNLFDGDKARDFLEVYNRIQHARKHQSIAGINEICGSHWGDRRVAACYFNEKQSWQMSQASRLDRLILQRAFWLHEHFYQVFTPFFIEPFKQICSIGQQLATKRD
jgi:hypothetical protein